MATVRRIGRCDVDVTGAVYGWELTRVGRSHVGLTGREQRKEREQSEQSAKANKVPCT